MANSNPLTTHLNGAAPIGYIVGGGLKENLRVRLTIPATGVQEGAFVVIDTPQWLFYGLVVDLQLGSTDPRFADEQSEQRLPAGLAQLLHGQTLYTTLVVLPSLMLERGPEPGSIAYENWLKDHGGEPAPITNIKTVPPHHAMVRMASAGDVAEIFGKPEEPGNFVIGYTREQNHPVCLNLDKLIQRSSGIFGATGSGKSFLARMLLAGLIQRDRASVLVFDMHNEYGFDDTASDTNQAVPGLQSKLGKHRVEVVGVGAGARIHNQSVDYNLEIRESDILPLDIELLTRELALRETTSSTLDALVNSFHRDWFTEFKNMKVGSVEEDPESGKKSPAPDSVAYWANQNNVNVMAAEGLHNKLGKLFRKEYIVERTAQDNLETIISSLKAGRNVVLSFGNYESDLDYLFITNLLTRRIREAWVELTDDFKSKKGGAREPRPLVIVLEEAHKLLNPEMANQTSFSTIAREMRKYYVTLLVIDQRPSQIYDDVISQLGTRVVANLGDDDDIRGVMAGQPGRDALREMLSHLQPKEEALILGWGVRMPILVRTRRYDESFWRDLKQGDDFQRRVDGMDTGEKIGLLGF